MEPQEEMEEAEEVKEEAEEEAEGVKAEDLIITDNPMFFSEEAEEVKEEAEEEAEEAEGVKAEDVIITDTPLFFSEEDSKIIKKELMTDTAMNDLLDGEAEEGMGRAEEVKEEFAVVKEDAKEEWRWTPENMKKLHEEIELYDKEYAERTIVEKETKKKEKTPRKKLRKKCLLALGHQNLRSKLLENEAIKIILEDILPEEREQMMKPQLEKEKKYKLALADLKAMNEHHCNVCPRSFRTYHGLRSHV